MNQKYIERTWHGYQQIVMPKDASQEQINETRKAFFSGASILFNFIMINLSNGTDETESDMQLLDSIQKEIDEFGQQLDQSVLGKVKH